MAFYDEISAILEASTAAGPNTSWPIYLGHMPDSTAIGDRAVAVVELPGPANPGRVELDPREFTVTVRGRPLLSVSTSYQEAELEAKLVRDTLHGYSGSSDSDDRHYVGILTLQRPWFSGFDEAHRPVFTAEFSATRSRTT